MLNLWVIDCRVSGSRSRRGAGQRLFRAFVRLALGRNAAGSPSSRRGRRPGPSGPAASLRGRRRRCPPAVRLLGHVHRLGDGPREERLGGGHHPHVGLPGDATACRWPAGTRSRTPAGARPSGPAPLRSCRRCRCRRRSTRPLPACSPASAGAAGTVWLTIFSMPPPASCLYLTRAMSGSMPVVSQSIMKLIVPVGASTVAWALRKPCRRPLDEHFVPDLAGGRLAGARGRPSICVDLLAVHLHHAQHRLAVLVEALERPDRRGQLAAGAAGRPVQQGRDRAAQPRAASSES